MRDDQAALKAEYRRLLKERKVFQERVNTEILAWNGKGEKPAALATAEAERDSLDVELARIADRVRF